MRLRNIPGSDETVAAHPDVVTDGKAYRGKWHQVFDRKAPLHIEIGMGKGQFLMGLAKTHPEINYLGIERYSAVLLRGLERKDSEAGEGIENLRFMCFDAAELAEVFDKGEVERIYLNFSDPWPKARHARRRLTSGAFLERYAEVLAPEGWIEFKTDNRGLFDFSVEEIEAAGWQIKQISYDLHNDEVMNAGNIMTEYEEKFSAKGNPIHKLIAMRV